MLGGQLLVVVDQEHRALLLVQEGDFLEGVHRVSGTVVSGGRGELSHPMLRMLMLCGDKAELVS